MQKVNVPRFGLACGITLAIGDLACVVVKGVLSTETQIRLFNMLLHGVDITTVMRNEMSIAEMALGFIAWFAIGSVFGAILGSAYNVAQRIGTSPEVSVRGTATRRI